MIIMSDMPVPERRTALLVPNRKDADGRPAPIVGATVHDYSHTEEIGVGTDDHGFAHIFKCRKTGTTRRYGFEGLPAADDGGEA